MTVLTPVQQAALDRLGDFYDGQFPFNSTTNPGGLRNGGHRVNFVPALVDVSIAVLAAANFVAQALATGADVTAASAIAQPLLDQAIARLHDALQAVEDAEAARDRAEFASGVVTGDLQAKFEGLLPGLPLAPPDVVGKMYLSAGDGGSGQLMITTTGVRSDAQPVPQPPIVHLVTSDELDAHKRLTRALSFAFH